MQTRGMLCLTVSTPPRQLDAHFEWSRPPAPDADWHDLHWYVDGSMYDEFPRESRSLGYSLVALDVNGQPTAWGCGTPLPGWSMRREPSSGQCAISCASRPSLPGGYIPTAKEYGRDSGGGRKKTSAPPVPSAERGA